MKNEKNSCYSPGLRPRALVALTTVFMLTLGAAWLTKPYPVHGEQAQGSQVHVAAAVGDADLPRRFAQDIWPLLTRPSANCVACHTKGNPSQLHLPADARSSYSQLLAEGRFDVHSPSSLLARVASTDPAQRMPPTGMPGWTAAEQGRLRDFMAAQASVSAARVAGPPADEQFPAALLLPYSGRRRSSGSDNTFLSYYQLRHKIATLFGDDWRRGDRDQYLANLAQLGGADFVTRFDESTRPSPAYLSAVSELSADAAARAYLNKAGPFEGRPELMPLPSKGANAQTRLQIGRLFRRLLFRDPSPSELRDSENLLRSVAAAQAARAKATSPLLLQVVVSGDDGRDSVRQAEIAVLPRTNGVSTFLVNENAPAADPQTVLGVWPLSPGDHNQRLVVSNRETSGKVTFQALILRGPLPEKTETVIGTDSPSTIVDGAWNSFGPNAKDGYSDGGENKGQSRLTVPMRVTRPGKYEVAVRWRKNEAGVNSPAVPFTVYAPGQSHFALPPAPPIPARGQASYFLDQTVDNVSYFDLQTAFQFDPHEVHGGVEISNKDTHKRVVADAVSYIPEAASDDTPALIVRANDAVGHEHWPIFSPKDFTPYNTIGPDLRSDDNAHKGDLSLLFAPTASLPSDYYHLRLSYPGHVDNDTRVPITVYAQRSSPVVRLRAPTEAPIGASFLLDASASYNVQHSALHYTWSQIGGPQAVLSGVHAPVLTVHLAEEGTPQLAWEGLCRALVLHPDFLFTRPRSLAVTRDPATRRRLQLVKLAQDLVGRPPTTAETARLDRGASLGTMADSYLASAEFSSFYYRRVRLYLESHGTPTQDEPARLWRYLLKNNRPYTELLTANYTIEPSGFKKYRPAYCGHSGVLTMPGFIEGKPGLPHFNYAAQVCEKFLGYVFEVTPEVVKARGTLTAASTVDPKSICYSCHQVLTPLAYQRTRWTDAGKYQEKTDEGHSIDDTDRKAVASYPFKGQGLEAFAQAAQRKERFHRAIIQTHFVWFFGRPLRYDGDERGLYKRLWDSDHQAHFALKPLVRALVTSPEYLGNPGPEAKMPRVARR